MRQGPLGAPASSGQRQFGEKASRSGGHKQHFANWTAIRERRNVHVRSRVCSIETLLHRRKPCSIEAYKGDEVNVHHGLRVDVVEAIMASEFATASLQLGS